VGCEGEGMRKREGGSTMALTCGTHEVQQREREAGKERGRRQSRVLELQTLTPTAQIHLHLTALSLPVSGSILFRLLSQQVGIRLKTKLKKLNKMPKNTKGPVSL
jgi:hypothetical protein